LQACIRHLLTGKRLLLAYGCVKRWNAGSKGICANLSWFSGPEGRKTVATPARAWTMDRGSTQPRSGERFSDESFATPWLMPPRTAYPRLTPWAKFLRPSGPENQLKLALMG
jgi:hypothetical protein